MFISDYEKLSDARDNAAYRALGAISAAICYCRQQNTADALSILTRALEAYERADEKLQGLKAQGVEQVHSIAAA
jgi:predicted negative regulator of RcsB-dependent stress response